MPNASNLLLFMAAALALNITPGPDMLYVIGRSTSGGRTAGLVSALGIGAGTTVHIAAVALGLSALLVQFPIAFDVVRWSGALYLAWLGLRAIFAGPSSRADARAPRPASLGAVFRQGMITNILNPKVALFFLAFLPQFVDPAASLPPAAQVAALGLMFDVSGTAVNLVVALGASGAAGWMRRRTADDAGQGAPLLQRLTGVLFIGLAVRLAFGGRR